MGIDYIYPQFDVFRTTPVHKLRIVKNSAQMVSTGLTVPESIWSVMKANV